MSATHPVSDPGFPPADDRSQRLAPDEKLANALGIASAALGAAMTPDPAAFARMIGIRDDARTQLWTRVVGAREFVHAAGLLSRPRPAPWAWTRVAGDTMDTALLLSALGKREDTTRFGLALGAAAAIGAVDFYTAVRLSRRPAQAAQSPTGGDDMRVGAAVTVRKPVEEVYAFWRSLENLPRFMDHLETVRDLGGGRSRWAAKAPLGRTVEWDAETVEDRPNELLAWRSLPGSKVTNSGTVRFKPAPGDRGTEVSVELHYDPPGGKAGAVVAKLAGEEPQMQVDDDLRRFKQIAETGVIARSDGTPEGSRARRQVKQRPAQPLPTPAGASS